MPSARLLATRFREGDRMRCDGAYRSRSTTQTWVVRAALRDPARLLAVYAELRDVPGGRRAAEKFRKLADQALAAATGSCGARSM